jgi:SHS2 domain-containing protein
MHHQPPEEVIACIDEAIKKRRNNYGTSSPGKAIKEDNRCIPTDTLNQTISQAEPGKNFEYLDHTADIQLHSWGNTLQESLEQLVLSLFHYMTDLSKVDVQKDISEENGRCIVAEGHDLHSLVYSFLNEWLCNFYVSGFIPKVVRIQTLDTDGPYKIVSDGEGELFDLNKHTQDAEVKAITYSNMQVIRDHSSSCWDVYVIVDI